MNYNQAKQIVQSESYLNAADQSIIRRKGVLFDSLEDNDVDNIIQINLETLNERNIHEHFQKGDIAYEALGLFTEEKVDRYCMTQQNRGSEAMMKKIDKDANSICHLYWYSKEKTFFFKHKSFY
jgi:hypothetical protein